MSKTCTTRIAFSLALAFGVGACGGPGLPPAGPKPGDVDVGYGTQPGEKVTGAVSTVKAENVGGGQQSANVAELLRGRVAGLEVRPDPAGGYSYRIRGLSTINQNAPEPLFVIDGIQTTAKDVPSALSGLTRDDIRQVDVLKDIASTSIYGTRGVGGVIVITTRR